jgi:hypothetical protein
MITNMLDLSTANMPSEPLWGNVRYIEHEYGFIAFVSSSADFNCVPSWLHRSYKKAIDNNCILINFDRDAEIDKSLPHWEW